MHSNTLRSGHTGPPGAPHPGNRSVYSAVTFQVPRALHPTPEHTEVQTKSVLSLSEWSAQICLLPELGRHTFMLPLAGPASWYTPGVRKRLNLSPRGSLSGFPFSLCVPMNQLIKPLPFLVPLRPQPGLHSVLYLSCCVTCTQTAAPSGLFLGHPLRLRAWG